MSAPGQKLNLQDFAEPIVIQEKFIVRSPMSPGLGNKQNITIFEPQNILNLPMSPNQNRRIKNMSALMKSQDDFSKKDQNGNKANFKTINSVSASQNVEKGTFAK